MKIHVEYLLILALTVILSISIFGAFVVDPLQAKLDEALVTCPESMVCYEPYGADVQAEYVLQGSLVFIHWVPEGTLPDDTEAQAEWEVDYDSNMSVCLITATPPQHVLGDPYMDALGHELLHCLIGDFHP